jgi:hypothetical protein
LAEPVRLGTQPPPSPAAKPVLAHPAPAQSKTAPPAGGGRNAKAAAGTGAANEPAWWSPLAESVGIDLRWLGYVTGTDLTSSTTPGAARKG